MVSPEIAAVAEKLGGNRRAMFFGPEVDDPECRELAEQQLREVRKIPT